MHCGTYNTYGIPVPSKAILFLGLVWFWLGYLSQSPERNYIGRSRYDLGSEGMVFLTSSVARSPPKALGAAAAAAAAAGSGAAFPSHKNWDRGWDIWKWKIP